MNDEPKPLSPADAEADMAAWRRHFPVFENKVYLNSCAYGALSHEVRAAYDAYLDSREKEGSYWDHWAGKNDELRRSIARLLEVKPQEIAITASLSAGLNALVSALDFSGARRKVVVSDFEFPTVGQIWLNQQRRGAEVVFASEEGGRVPVAAFDRLIDDKTLIVALTHVCYRNGARNDVQGIAEIARERGALLMLDSYQAVGSMPVAPRAMGADFCAAGVLKYLLASAGLGFLWVREELIQSLDPLFTGWWAQENIFAMDHRSHTPAPDARRFECGTPPVPNVYAAIAGLEVIHKVGPQAIQRHVGKLNARLKAGLAEAGFTLSTPADPDHHGAMLAVKSNDMAALCHKLEGEDIVTSYRDGNLRISPHFYNNANDIDALLEGLSRHRDLLA